MDFSGIFEEEEQCKDLIVVMNWIKEMKSLFAIRFGNLIDEETELFLLMSNEALSKARINRTN